MANNFKLKEFDVLLLHGDMEQAERNKVITSFRKQEVPIMVATDVAGNALLFKIPCLRPTHNYSTIFLVRLLNYNIFVKKSENFDCSALKLKLFATINGKCLCACICICIYLTPIGYIQLIL